MILRVHVPGAHLHLVGDEIWHEPLADAIHAEAETIAEYAGPEMLKSRGVARRADLRDQVVAEMTSALRRPSDAYRAPDRVRYTLEHEPPAGSWFCGARLGRPTKSGTGHVAAAAAR
jgi:hypothetical protein